MAGHRLVHGQVADHVVVVFPVERLDPLRRPVRRGGRDAVERRHIGRLQRPRRIAVGDRHTPRELRHLLDDTRVTDHADQVVVAHEVTRLVQRHRGEVDDGGVVRVLGGQQVQRPAYRLVVGRATDQLDGRRADLLGDPFQVGPGAALHLGGAQLGVERVPQPRLPAPPAQPRVTPRARVGRQTLPQPRHELLQRGDRLRGRRADPVTQRRRLGEQRRHLVADQRRRAGELPDRRLRVDARHVPQRRARRRKRIGYGRQAPGEAGQALLGGGEGTGQQGVQQRPRIVAQRIPLVGANLGGLEQPSVDHAGEQRVVDALRHVERVRVDLGERVRRVLQHRLIGGERVRGQIGQPVVVAVVPGGGGQPGPALQQRLHDPLRQRYERLHTRHPTDHPRPFPRPARRAGHPPRHPPR